MSFQILDFILFGIMAVSGLLALARGFTREVLSLVAWGLAALAAYAASKQKPLLDFVASHVEPTKPLVAQIIVAAVAFLLVLIIVSIFSVKISDRVVDSRIGGFDRTLGFFYGLARGLVLVAVAYLFYGWLLPLDRQEDWVRNAVSLPAIRSVGNIMLGLMPPDIAQTLTNSAQAINPAETTGNKAGATEAQPTYSNGQTKGLDNLIDGTNQKTDQTTKEPAFGQSTTQQ
jgi:membrane protein required for colicin V production